jgi:hypothetical protein
MTTNDSSTSPPPRYSTYINNGGFIAFSRAFTTYTQRKGLGTLLTGVETEPTVPLLDVGVNDALHYAREAVHSAWMRRDDQLQGELKECLGQEYNSCAVGSTGAECWNNTVAYFDNHDNGFSLAAMACELPTLKMENFPYMTAYVNKLSDLVAMLSAQKCVLPDILVTAFFLNGLPTPFGNLVTDYKRQKTLPPLATIKAEFFAAEQEFIRTGVLSTIGKAFPAKSKTRVPPKKKPITPGMTCSIHGPGHSDETCYTQHPELSPHKVLMALTERIKVLELEKSDYPEFRSFPAGLMAGTCGNLGNSCIFLDSGASQHMTSDYELLQNYQPFDKHEPIIVGNGQPIFAEGRGNLTVHGLTLSRVLYIPKLCATLVSVSALTATGCTVSFHDQKYKITSSNGTILLEGVSKNGMFEVKALMASPMLDHRRYGHLFFFYFANKPTY